MPSVIADAAKTGTQPSVTKVVNGISAVGALIRGRMVLLPGPAAMHSPAASAAGAFPGGA